MGYASGLAVVDLGRLNYSAQVQDVWQWPPPAPFCGVGEDLPDSWLVAPGDSDDNKSTRPLHHPLYLGSLLHITNSATEYMRT